MLATNRQIPSWLGKLGRRTAHRTSRSALAAIAAFALVIPGDIKLLAGVYAFGALLAIAIAHVSVLWLRVKDPDRERPFRVPFDVSVRGHRLPVPTLIAAVITILAWGSVIAFHDSARYRRRRVDDLRPWRVRRLPAGGRGHVADEADQRFRQRR